MIALCPTSVVVRHLSSSVNNFFKQHLLNHMANCKPFKEMILSWYPVKVVQKIKIQCKLCCHDNQLEKL